MTIQPENVTQSAGTKSAHFVTFLSPGSFVHEETRKAVESWDVEQAKVMARDIVERYSAKPFAFEFSTQGRGPDDLDSKEVARSPRYYLGGKIETLAEVEARATKEDRILISNMRANNWERVITNTNSWRITQPLKPNDVVLEWEPAAVTGGGS